MKYTVEKITARGYIKPVAPHMGSEEKKVYAAERKLHEALDKATKELMEALNIPTELFWKQGLPEALLNLLDSYDTNACILAATAYLERYGFEGPGMC